MSVSIRLIRAEDLDAADRITMRAFKTTDSYRPTIERHFAIHPNSYWVSEDSNGLTGAIGAAIYGHIAYVNMMAVDPDAQGQGIGTKLLETLLENVSSPTLLLDATEAAEPLYRKYGFDDESWSYDLNGHVHAASAASAPFTDIIALDAKTFGSNRQRAIQHLLTEPEAQLFTAKDAFLLAQKSVLGPWIAPDPETAEALLAQVPPKQYRVMIPQENEQGLALLERHGFTIRRKVRHMRRGPRIDRHRAVNYGQASFALG